LTATATPDVIEDILSQLRIPDAEVVHTGFYRPNLELEVIPADGASEKRIRLLERLRRTEGACVVYAATVKAVEELRDFLEGQGLAAGGYHGRMAARRRTAVQD